MAVFTIAHSERRPDGRGGFVSGEPLFLRVVCFDDLATNALETLRAGDRVIATGKLKAVRRGDGGTDLEMKADDFGLSLKYTRRNQ